MAEDRLSDNRSWSDTAADTGRSAADRARLSAPQTYDTGSNAPDYVSQSVQQYPLSGLVIAALLGYVIGFLLHHQSFGGGTSRNGRGWSNRGARQYRG